MSELREKIIALEKKTNAWVNEVPEKVASRTLRADCLLADLLFAEQADEMKNLAHAEFFLSQAQEHAKKLGL